MDNSLCFLYIIIIIAVIIIIVIVTLKQFMLRTRLDCLILKMKALRSAETSLAL